jgi:copper homeostasis protein
MTTLEVEIAVTTPHGARVAAEAGADRVELCGALEVGGITPSAALLRIAVATGIGVHALIRNRPGDFVYDADDVRCMADDAAFAASEGAAGVVIGALTAGGGLDRGALETIAGAAREANPLVQLTFHRAIDHTADPAGLLDELAALGFGRVLTSGGASSASDGAGVLAAMVARGSGLQIMAGGGVLPAHIDLLAALGVDAVHLSAKARATARPATDGAPWVSLGSSSTDAAADAHFVTDESVVRDAVARAAAARR